MFIDAAVCYYIDPLLPEGTLKFHLIDSNPKCYPVECIEFHISPLCRLGPEERAGAPSACLTEELQRLKAEEQEKQLQQLEESHRQEMERLRAHYQQQATESEERYLTELFMLQQRLQEVTGTQTHPR